MTSYPPLPPNLDPRSGSPLSGNARGNILHPASNVNNNNNVGDGGVSNKPTAGGSNQFHFSLLDYACCCCSPTPAEDREPCTSPLCSKRRCEVLCCASCHTSRSYNYLFDESGNAIAAVGKASKPDPLYVALTALCEAFVCGAVTCFTMYQVRRQLRRRYRIDPDSSGCHDCCCACCCSTCLTYQNLMEMTWRGDNPGLTVEESCCCPCYHGEDKEKEKEKEKE